MKKSNRQSIKQASSEKIDKPLNKGADDVLSSAVKFNLLIILGLALLTFFIFKQVQGHEFVLYDDDVYVFENPHIQNGINWTSIKWAFSACYAANWHPLTWLSHMADWTIYGNRAGGHHYTSVLLHIGCVLLIFLGLKRMTGYTWRSAFAAAIFAIHPLRAESVAWVAERKDVLCAFFLFLTIWAYLLYREKPMFRRYIWVALFLFMGLMAKPMLVTAPFLLLILDFWVIKTKSNQTNTNQKSLVLNRIYDKLLLFIPVIISSYLTFYAQTIGQAVKNLNMLSINERLANAVTAIGFYLAKLIAPYKLAVIYPHPYSPLGNPPFVIGIPAWKILLSTAAIITITVLAIQNRKTKPYLIAGWLWFIISILPVLGIIQVGGQAYADRYTYIPLLGISTALVWLLADWFNQLKQRYEKQSNPINYAQISLAVLAIAIYGYLGMQQTKVFKNTFTLFANAIKHTGPNPVALNNLGQAYERKGEYETAIPYYLKALEYRPGYFTPSLYNMGNSLFCLKRYEEALPYFEQAILASPELPQNYDGKGRTLFQLRRYSEAISAFEIALKIQPNLTDTLMAMSMAYIKMEQYPQAYDKIYLAYQFKPDNPNYSYFLGWLEAKQNKHNEAVNWYKISLNLQPDNPMTLFDLGNSYFALGNFDDALNSFLRAEEIAPNNPDNVKKIADSYRQKNDKANAEKYIEIYNQLVNQKK